MVLYVMMYNMTLHFESLSEILKCDDRNESCRVADSCSAGFCFSIWGKRIIQTHQEQSSTTEKSVSRDFLS